MVKALHLKEGLDLGFEVEAWLEPTDALHFEALRALGPSAVEVKSSHL